MFNYKSKRPDIDIKTGFYNRCLFDFRLCEERRRTERSGLPFSVLSIDIRELAEAAKKHQYLTFTQIRRAVSEMVRENCRFSDIKSWYDDTTLKIILPDTSMTDAYVLFEKLNAKFNNGLRSSFDIEKKFDFKKTMMITTFPEAIKDTESECGKQTGSEGNPENMPGSKPSGTGGTSTAQTLKWDPLHQRSLTWPLYSDILHETDLSRLEQGIKRAMDIAGALAGIILFSPIMLMIAILIKITSRGPVLFRQQRLGFLGKKFIFLKFRSMYAHCSEERHKEYVTKLIKNRLDTGKLEPECAPLYKMNDDPRITSFGRFLRRTSLDELPQLFNVLKGEMSLVGPRPPIPYEVEKYENWHFRRVLEVKPGITGLWQVKGRSMTTFDEMVRLDIAYVNNFSLWLDIKILFKTVWVVISAKGAY